METTGLQQAVERLLSFTDEEFKEHVDLELRGTLTGIEREAFQDPRVIERQLLALIAMKRTIETQIGSRKSDLAQLVGSPVFNEKRKDFHRWRASSLRVRNRIDVRLSEVRHSLNGTFVTSNTRLEEERNRALGENALLRAAIRAHQSRTMHEFDEYTEHDVELWNVLKGDK